MTQAMIELQSGFDERMTELGQRFSLPRTGDQFDAILLPVNPVDPQLDLGSDWRELATMEGRRDRMPAINYGDTVIQIQPFWATDALASPPKWKVIRRDDNPANFAVKFWLVKITDQDAQ